MLGYVVAVVATFFLTVYWQKHADNQNRLPLRLTIQSLMNELDIVSKKLGYQNVVDYWKSTKGEDFAKVALTNYNNAINSLK